MPRALKIMSDDYPAQTFCAAFEPSDSGFHSGREERESLQVQRDRELQAQPKPVVLAYSTSYNWEQQDLKDMTVSA